MPYDINTLINERPKLHIDRVGKPVSWGIEPEVLKLLERIVGPNSKSIETGAGLSTIAFSIKGATHHAIMPSEPVRDNILNFMAVNGINAEKLTVCCAKSQHFLPAFSESDFDIALIDGDHSFPIPLIDYYFLSKLIKIGGHLIVDNVEIWSGDILRRFLILEQEWEFIADLGKRASLFKKIADTTKDKGWAGQPYNLINSRFVAKEVLDLHMPKNF